ncbi:hypothetical protein [Aurantimonas sp. 22II-16-19i]|uniref:hypothetical protein n=1 Tax=Aurantimonas sp. 22II-16-19i TaxID=1317114 RepID=UPI0009F7BB06|nr:hypothetical protein [Aurantimonas sp. 22II-16-19i]ORE97745.1 hypothetical protein ATO4_07395 [Aurantimonas sp. 22II-16-19i]
MSLRLDHSPSDIPVLPESLLTEARRRASSRRFGPAGTVRCLGRPAFRSALARDLGLLLDLDPDVAAWWCLPAVVEFADGDGEVIERVPDFLVRGTDGRDRFLDAGETGLTPVDPLVAYRAVPEDEIRQEPLLSNARDAMRYAKRVVPLGDRVRLLAYLAEMSPITLVEAASAMRESSEPVGAVIALALRRIVRIDWEDTPIGPETAVRSR